MDEIIEGSTDKSHVYRNVLYHLQRGIVIQKKNKICKLPSNELDDCVIHEDSSLLLRLSPFSAPTVWCVRGRKILAV
jgi:hypothetical protein